MAKIRFTSATFMSKAHNKGHCIWNLPWQLTLNDSWSGDVNGYNEMRFLLAEKMQWGMHENE